MSGNNPQRLDVVAVERLLDGAGATGPVRALGSVTSTSDIAWAWAAAGCPEGAAFFAEEQVRGRGRFGRTWHCPRGTGLLLSMVLRPADPAITPAHITALAAVAVAEAVEETAGLQAAIRWPNDVTLGGRKLAGVLVERRTAGAAAACVVGIGLNVNGRPEAFPEAVRPTATTLEAATGRAVEREAVAAALLRRLLARYRDCTGGRWAAVAAAWRERSSLAGRQVEVQTEGGTVRGVAARVDPVAGIELEVASGPRCRLAAERAARVRVLRPAPLAQEGAEP